MVYITGDTHGDVSRFSNEAMPLASGDKLIVTGDFGFVFHNNLAEKNNLDALAKKSFEVLFIDGNHENFPALMRYPEEMRYGTPVRKIRENIFWLQRGYVYTIEGMTFFVFGGGYSTDKAQRLEYQRSTGDRVWFEEEMPSKVDYLRAEESLKVCNMQVDYILTHTAPRAIIPNVIGRTPDANEKELNVFLDEIYTNVHFRAWYFGHLHRDLRINDQMVACYKALHCLIKSYSQTPRFFVCILSFLSLLSLMVRAKTD